MLNLVSFFSLTTRGLALLRITVGLIWLYSILIRSSLYSVFFLDEGLLPFRLAAIYSDNVDVFFLHSFFDSDYFSLIVLVLSFIFSLFFILGIKTKYVAVISFFLMLALDSRNQFILNAGYETNRTLMFWMMFLPLDKMYTFNFFLNSKKENTENEKVESWFCVALIWQILIYYFFGGILKDSPDWKELGTATEMAMSNHYMSYPWSSFILSFNLPFRFITKFVLYLEIFAPFLLLFFWKKLIIRKSLLVLLIFFHLIVLFNFKVGFLPFLNLGALLLLWPYPSNKVIASKSSLMSLIPIFMILYLFLINLNSLPGLRDKFNQKYFFLSRLIMMDQSWYFFAPKPYPYDGWWEITGKDQNEKEYKLLILGDQIEDPKSYYWNSVLMEEKTFLIHLLKDHFKNLRENSLFWLCRRSSSKQKLKSVEMTFFVKSLPAQKLDDYSPLRLGFVECSQ